MMRWKADGRPVGVGVVLAVVVVSPGDAQLLDGVHFAVVDAHGEVDDAEATAADLVGLLITNGTAASGRRQRRRRRRL